MTDQIKRREPEQKLAPGERLSLSRSMTRDHEAFLAPGERFAVDAEVGKQGSQGAPEYVWAQLLLGRPDDSFRLEMEAAMVPGDQEPGVIFPEAELAMETLFAMLRVRLYDYFRQDRHALFHDDWRMQPFGEWAVRFRASQSNPGLDAQADALLDGEPV